MGYVEVMCGQDIRLSGLCELSVKVLWSDIPCNRFGSVGMPLSVRRESYKIWRLLSWEKYSYC